MTRGGVVLLALLLTGCATVPSKEWSPDPPTVIDLPALEAPTPAAPAGGIPGVTRAKRTG